MSCVLYSLGVVVERSTRKADCLSRPGGAQGEWRRLERMRRHLRGSCLFPCVK